MNSNKTILATALASVLAAPMASQALTSDDFLKWLAENQKAQATFSPGDVITYDKADQIRPFVPVGYQNIMIFDGMEATIQATSDLSPPKVYQDATAKYAGQAKLAADGAIENYVAGRPFDPETFVAGDKDSGYKASWNFNFRWQHGGLKIEGVEWVWVREGGSHENHDIMKNDYSSQFYGGGGNFQRVLGGPYQRVYFSHRADLADNDYKIAGKWAQGTEFRELTAFESPFDISGTAFLILRHDNPHKADDSWAYVPSLRRVRRISVEVKSDSLLGTDHTLEDFYCFAGRVLEHDWKYIGPAQILAVARSKYANTHYYGPNGWAVKDNWELRKVDVFQQIPKLETHPYSSKFIMTDRQSGEAYYCNAFDRAGELWKVWQLSKVWTEDPQYRADKHWKAPETPPGTRMSAFQSINVIDVQNGRGTLVPTRGMSYPDTDIRKVRRTHDVNYLTEGR